MENYKQEFINFSLNQGVLKFGEFELKSGRMSPYFFNMGLFNSGSTIAKLGDFYAQALVNEEKEFDLLFGPAYKGIPIVTSLASSLSKNHNIDKPFTFNRKEAKDHGEKGQLVGAPIKGKVLIVEEGSANFGWGSELAYQLSQIVPGAKINRIGARSVPIPSTRELEEDILVGKQDIINALRRLEG